MRLKLSKHIRFIDAMLLERLLEDLFRCWSSVFSQERTHARAVKLAFGLLLGMGRRTITRALCFHGDDQRDWSADYRLFSRSRWEAPALFKEIVPQLRQAGCLQESLVAIAWDDTGVPRSGKRVPGGQWMRDSMGPPFHVNLIWGQRFLQASVLVPLYEQDDESSPRAIPVGFVEVPAVKKPGKRAEESAWATYKEAKKKYNLSVAAVKEFAEMRRDFDARGLEQTTLLHTVDGSYMNRTTLAYDFERAVLLGRVRKDARLCYRCKEGGRRFYGERKFTPESVGRDKRRKWKTALIFHGGTYREVRYKEVQEVFWQGGGGRRPLRLLVVAPVAYRTTKRGRKYYRQKAYLLCTDEKIEAQVLLQKYFDRWQIEYNHRDEKDVLGVGEAQVWADESVRRVPTFIVACYSWMLVTALEQYGPLREEAVYEPLPRWRRKTRRASCRDMIDVLRREIFEGDHDWGPKLQSEADGRAMCLTSAA